MERKYLVALLVIGIAAGLYAAITYQWVVMVVVVAFVALILVASDCHGADRGIVGGDRYLPYVINTGLGAGLSPRDPSGGGVG